VKGEQNIASSTVPDKKMVFTAWCYAEHGYEIACYLSICLSV